MVTGTQPQTAWVPWSRDLAEMLETHLAEVKHKGELKVSHSEPLDHGGLLHTTIYWKNSWPAKSPPHWPVELLLCSTRILTAWALPGPSSLWDCQNHIPTRSHAPQAPLGPSFTLHYWIPAPPGSPAPWALLVPSYAWDCQAPLGPISTGFLDSSSIMPLHGSLHRRAPNLPKRHRQTGQDAKGVISKQLRL
jgi:hypothetical protein